MPISIAYVRLIESDSRVSHISHRYLFSLSHNSTDCDVCDASNPDFSKRHPIKNAIDGTESWWQSPSLKNGKRYEWVTININLRQVYEIAYVIIKSSISPLPLNWILERSIDGITYYPWQYFAQSDTECWEKYRVRPSIGKLRYRTDDEVICTSMYAKNNAIGNEEVKLFFQNKFKTKNFLLEINLNFSFERLMSH